MPRSSSRSRASGSASTYAPPRGTTRSRSISARTVSTAYVGIPSARSTSCVAHLGRADPWTRPSTRSPSRRSVSASRCSTVAPAVGDQLGVLDDELRPGQQHDEARERRGRQQVLDEAAPAPRRRTARRRSASRPARCRRSPARRTSSRRRTGPRAGGRRPRRRRAGPPGAARAMRARRGRRRTPRARAPPARRSSTGSSVPEAGLEPAPDRLGHGVVGHTLAVRHALAGSATGTRRRARRCTWRTPSRAATSRRRRRPTTTSSAGRPVSSTPWNSSLTIRSSRSRPTSGASRPSARCAPPAVRDDGAGRPQRHRLGLALELVRADVGVGDRRAGQQAGRLVDPHLARSGRRTAPATAVFTGSPATMPCISRTDGHRDLAGDDADPHRQFRDRRPPSRARPRQPTSSRPARTDRSASSSWVVGTPHTAITASPMNFSTTAAVAGDDPRALLEVAAQQLADVLLVARLRQRREPDEVAEQHAGDAARGDRRGRLASGVAVAPLQQVGTALVAELGAGRDATVPHDGQPARQGGRRTRCRTWRRRAGRQPQLGQRSWHRGRLRPAGGVRRRPRPGGGPRPDRSRRPGTPRGAGRAARCPRAP